MCGIDNSIVKQVMIHKTRFNVVQGRLRIKNLENSVLKRCRPLNKF